MLSALKCHPFAVSAFFESTLVLTYAVPKNELRHLLPPCLEPDTWQDQWAFIAVAMVNTKKLKPKPFPSFMGHDFFLAGYRIFVRYATSQGKRLRGLYILGSETDKRKMVLLGNAFTHYKYSLTDIDFFKNGSGISIRSAHSDILVDAALRENDPALPRFSPFSNWKEARRFAGPLPFSFSWNERTRKVLIIEGVRQHWAPKPVQVLKSNIGFINQLNLNDLTLASAFYIENIPYYWKKGITDKWTQQQESPSRVL